MNIDIEPRNKNIEDMPDMEMEESVRKAKRNKKLQEIFDRKMSEDKTEDKDLAIEKSQKLSDFIEIIINVKR